MCVLINLICFAFLGTRCRFVIFQVALRNTVNSNGMKSIHFVSFFSPTSLSDSPVVSFITKITNKAPIVHPIPWEIIAPCKSISSTSIGNSLTLTNARQLVKRQIIT